MKGTRVNAVLLLQNAASVTIVMPEAHLTPSLRVGHIDRSYSGVSVLCALRTWT
jgi:hypothetical protein